MFKINMYAGVACVFLVTSHWPHFLRNQFTWQHSKQTTFCLSYYFFLFSLKQTLIVNTLFLTMTERECMYMQSNC
jgi:hypothetical protein